MLPGLCARFDAKSTTLLSARRVRNAAFSAIRVSLIEGSARTLPEHGAGILWIDGKVDRLLAAGSYAFWKFNRNVSVELVDL